MNQSFNTTTSMGRLILNVLLSFAQFEREVTGERIGTDSPLRRRRECGWAAWFRSAIGSRIALCTSSMITPPSFTQFAKQRGIGCGANRKPRPIAGRGSSSNPVLSSLARRAIALSGASALTAYRVGARYFGAPALAESPAFRPPAASHWPRALGGWLLPLVPAVAFETAVGLCDAPIQDQANAARGRRAVTLAHLPHGKRCRLRSPPGRASPARFRGSSARGTFLKIRPGTLIAALPGLCCEEDDTEPATRPT